jgi:hypothetical protein
MRWILLLGLVFAALATAHDDSGVGFTTLHPAVVRSEDAGFFARGSHARENDRVGRRALICHSRVCLAREESRSLEIR